jgi:hypothetical protein
MSKITFLLTLIGTALICSLPAAPAQAQALRTFVSAAGSDSNNCTDVSTPCRHLAQAYAATAAGGAIEVLDPANYGGLTISQAISIDGHGWTAMAAGSGFTAISINAGPSDKINIRGVVIDGLGFANNTGISFTAGGSLNVQDSVIRNFGGVGIGFVPNASSSLFVSDTLLTDCGIGVYLAPTGAGTDTAVFNRVEVYNNAPVEGFSILGVNSSGGSITATVSESTISGNTNGIHVKSTSGQAVAKVTVFHSVVANSQFNGFIVDGTNATVTLAQSAVMGNAGTGWDILNSGVIQTYLDNYFNGNGTNTGSLTTIGKQ